MLFHFPAGGILRRITFLLFLQRRIQMRRSTAHYCVTAVYHVYNVQTVEQYYMYVKRNRIRSEIDFCRFVIFNPYSYVHMNVCNIYVLMYVCMRLNNNILYSDYISMMYLNTRKQFFFLFHHQVRIDKCSAIMKIYVFMLTTFIYIYR